MQRRRADGIKAGFEVELKMIEELRRAAALGRRERLRDDSLQELVESRIAALDVGRDCVPIGAAKEPSPERARGECDGEEEIDDEQAEPCGRM